MREIKAPPVTLKTTIRDLWEEYFNACYGGVTISRTQRTETEQAFFAGVYTFLAAQHQIVDFPEEDAAAWIEKRKIECEHEARRRIREAEARDAAH